jgi:hypothetical protein
MPGHNGGLHRRVKEWSLQAMTGVVDQDLNRDSALAKACVQPGDGGNVRQIDLLHDDIGAVLLVQHRRQGLQSIEPACHQNQRVAPRRILPGELFAKTAGRSSDENP